VRDADGRRRSACPEHGRCATVYVTASRAALWAVRCRVGDRFQDLIYMIQKCGFSRTLTRTIVAATFRNHIYCWQYRDRPVPDAKSLSIRSSANSSSAPLRLTCRHEATMCYLPGIETPEKECWYINMGAVDRAFFTTEAM